MKIAFVLGTRPEIIKMAPIIRECQKKKIKFYIIHSGQHYSYNLDKIFFKQLNLPIPQYNLDVGSLKPTKQISEIILKTSEIFEKNKPDIVFVQGDTNTVLGGAIAAKKLFIKIGHVEAGLRSYDERMPEEINRRLTDHCSDLLFAPTKMASDILISEGIARKKIFVTGNTIVDSVNQNLKFVTSDILEKINIKSQNYFLISLHRQETVDNKKTFQNVIKALKILKKKYNIPLIFPIHPRTRKMAKKFKINLDGLTLIEPVDYFGFLALERNAKLVLTDSGGVQEETCILGIPCVTLRENTERPETIDVGSNKIAGTQTKKIIQIVNTMVNKKRNWKQPFGNGKSSEKIIRISKLMK